MAQFGESGIYRKRHIMSKGENISKKDIQQAKYRAEYEMLFTRACWNKLLRNPILIIAILLLYGYTIYSNPHAIWSLPALPAFRMLSGFYYKKVNRPNPNP
jgi:hypothetical protein